MQSLLANETTQALHGEMFKLANSHIVNHYYTLIKNFSTVDF